MWIGIPRWRAEPWCRKSLIRATHFEATDFFSWAELNQVGKQFVRALKMSSDDVNLTHILLTEVNVFIWAHMLININFKKVYIYGHFSISIHMSNSSNLTLIQKLARSKLLGWRDRSGKEPRRTVFYCQSIFCNKLFILLQLIVLKNRIRQSINYQQFSNKYPVS